MLGPIHSVFAGTSYASWVPILQAISLFENKRFGPALGSGMVKIAWVNFTIIAGIEHEQHETINHFN
jgi:hypothetical protein